MISKDQLEEALCGSSDADLLAMAKRLTRSIEEMDSYHVDLLAEQEELRNECSELKATIEAKLKDIAKLDIGAMNLREPELEEGPLDFIGRFWEKVKPRDNTVVIDEHIGELKHAPRDGEEPVDPLSEFKEQMNIAADAFSGLSERWREQGSDIFQAARDWRRDQTANDEEKIHVEGPRVTTGDTVGKLVSDVQELWPPTADRLSGAVSAFSAFAGSMREQAAVKWPGLVTPSKYQDWGSGVLGPFTAEEETEAGLPGYENLTGALGFGLGLGLEPSSSRSSTDDAPPAADGAGAPPQLSPELDRAQRENTATRPATPMQDQATEPTPLEAAMPKGTTPTARDGGDEEELSLVIEASITLDDGSVEVLRMNSRERASEAAARFVRDHSLKAWFEEPLRKYLRQVENDAIRLPAKVEADLQEIRKTFRK
mmetsp:Transcript_27540/g.50444  ORF Transcript_27540/g.50444 Transcript_27540/m.50444 type:complete len:428 (+) Transcript_27540:61-1344(+)